MVKIRYDYYNSENFKIAYVNKDSISSINITENRICMNNGGGYDRIPEEDLFSILHFFEHNV